MSYAHVSPFTVFRVGVAAVGGGATMMIMSAASLSSVLLLVGMLLMATGIFASAMSARELSVADLGYARLIGGIASIIMGVVILFIGLAMGSLVSVFVSLPLFALGIVTIATAET